MWSTASPAVRRRLAVGGMLAPLILTAAVVVTASARPDYHHSEHMISVLGEIGGPLAAVMNFGGFLVYGVLVLGLALGLHAGIRNAAGDWLGPFLLGIYGLGYVGVAFAPCSPGCTGSTPALSEQAHFLISRVIILTAIAGPLVLFGRLAKDPAWAAVKHAVLLLTVVGYLLFLLPLPGLGSGLQQRLFVGCTLACVLVMAWRLFRVSSSTAGTARAAA